MISAMEKRKIGQEKKNHLSSLQENARISWVKPRFLHFDTIDILDGIILRGVFGGGHCPL